MPTTAHIPAPAAAPETPAAETPAAYIAAYEKFDHLVSRLRSPQTQRMTHSALEQLLETEGRELLRRLLQAHLADRAPGTVTVAVSDAAGQAHTHQRTQRRELESVFGTVEIARTGYGGRGLECLHPLDAELNLPAERYSHCVRRRAAELPCRAVF